MITPDNMYVFIRNQKCRVFECMHLPQIWRRRRPSILQSRFSSASFLGTVFHQRVWRSARKLNCDSEWIRNNNTKVLMMLTERYWMYTKLVNLTTQSEHMSAVTFQLQFNWWDNELTKLMASAKDKVNDNFPLDKDGNKSLDGVCSMIPHWWTCSCTLF